MTAATDAPAPGPVAPGPVSSGPVSSGPVAPPESQGPTSESLRPPPAHRLGRVRGREWAAIAALLALTAALYLWRLADSGWANSFYTAAAQAGATGWKAWLFGSSDPANAITVDKTPGFLWIIGVSTRLFGVNPWAILAPQALEGVAAVGVLYAAVRRTSGHGAGLLAGAALALTPAATLMFRFDNPDALLVLLITVAAYCTIRAVDGRSLRGAPSTHAPAAWIAAAGAAVGFAFLAKELQAFIIVPVLAGVYACAAPVPLRRRLAHLAGAAGAVVVCAGWYLALVALWPADDRPYIGGSQHDSIIGLTLGYNGLGRLTGDEAGGLGNTSAEAGWSRLFDSAMGGEIAWLIPAALILGAAGLWALGRRAAERAALALWLGWLLLAGAVLSFAAGIVHPYYTVMLAPAVAGSVGVGAAAVWRRREKWWARAALAAAVLAAVGEAAVLLARKPHWQPWLTPAICTSGIVIAAVLALAPQLVAAARALAATPPTPLAAPLSKPLAAPLPTPLAAPLALTAAVCVLAAPGAYSLATASVPHRGAIPSAGPKDRHLSSLPLLAKIVPGVGFGTGHAGTGHEKTGQSVNPAVAGAPAGLHRSTLLDAAATGPVLTRMLREDAGRYTWAAATVGSNSAAGFQLTSGEPVMAVGGYNGTDPFPTLEDFRRMVAAGRIHYFLDSSVARAGAARAAGAIPPGPLQALLNAGTGPRAGTPPAGGTGTAPSNPTRRSRPAPTEPDRIAAWVAAHYTPIDIDGQRVYDLTDGTDAADSTGSTSPTDHREAP